MQAKHALLRDEDWLRRPLSWLLQKDALGQDALLLGTPGSGWARRLCVRVFAGIEEEQKQIGGKTQQQQRGRRLSHVVLTRDTCESDLKQRRELRRTKRSGNGEGEGEGGQATTTAELESVWIDGPVVRAALNGEILLLEGLEHAERNVLPILNNLLENREMQLEDGRFLCDPVRFEKIKREQLGSLAGSANGATAGVGPEQLRTKEGVTLVKVHPRFRVIALGSPVPPFPGNPLDPPLRSRFQCLRVEAPIATPRLLMRFSQGDRTFSRFLLEFSAALHALVDHRGSDASRGGTSSQGLGLHSVPQVDNSAVLTVAQTAGRWPHRRIAELLWRIYPWEQLVRGDVARAALQRIWEQGVEKFEGEAACPNGCHRGYAVVGATQVTGGECKVTLSALCTSNSHSSGARQDMVLPAQPFAWNFDTSLSPAVRRNLASLLQSHDVGMDLCLIGERGSGKTFLLEQFGNLLGCGVDQMFCFSEMSARDFLQRRSTSEDGSTIWIFSPLVRAAVFGRLLILDGLDRLAAGTASALLPLLQDRELTMADGARLVPPKKFRQMLDSTGKTPLRLFLDDGVLGIHPRFRIAATATVGSQQAHPWLTQDMLPAFHFFRSSPVKNDLEESGALSDILLSRVPELQHAPYLLQAILSFADTSSE